VFLLLRVAKTAPDFSLDSGIRTWQKQYVNGPRGDHRDSLKIREDAGRVDPACLN
jgi:hypothetical protein